MLGLRVSCVLLLLVNFLVSSTLSFDVRVFDDTILFKINWPGKTGADLLVSSLFSKVKYHVTAFVSNTLFKVIYIKAI